MDDSTIQEQLAKYNLEDLLVAAFRKDQSWFNTMFELVDEGVSIPNSYEAYTKLLQGVIGVGEAGGFPWAAFRAMIPSRIDEVRALVMR